MTGIKGYPDEKKRATDGAMKHATAGRVGEDQIGLDVRTWAFVDVVADAAEALSTATVIVATAHVARVGDLIAWTSGNLIGREYFVNAVSANSITVEHAMAEAPAVADAFMIRRRKALAAAGASGAALVTLTEDHGAGVVGATTLRTAEGGHVYADSVYYSYAVPVTTAAWVQIIAVTAAVINWLTCLDSSGEVLELGVGAAGFESRRLIIPRGGIDAVPLNIPAGSRVSLRALSANATGGEHTLTGLQ